jgi:hypothetical protein
VRGLAIVLIVLGALSALHAAQAADCQDDAAATDTQTAAGEPIPLAAPWKTYVMQAVDQANVGDARLRKADGIVIRTKWATIEPAPGQFVLDWPKAQIARAAGMGKLIQFQVLSGDDAPAWLESLGAKVMKFNRGQIPLPWDEVFQTRYRQMIEHIARNLDWSKVTHFHSIGANNAEWHYQQFNNGAIYRVDSFNDEAMVNAHVRAVGTLVTNLPRVIIVCDIGDHNRSWTRRAIDALKAEYAGHVGFQMCALKASTSLGFEGFTRIQQAAAERHHAGFEMIGPSQTNDGRPVPRFAGPFSEAIRKAEMTKAQWLCVYQPDL